MLQNLLDGHAALRNIADEIEAMLDGSGSTELGKFGQLRWALTREVMQHLYFEEHFVFLQLAKNPREAVRAIAAEFKESLTPLYTTYQEHMQHWQALSQAEWPAYEAATRKLLGHLRARMDDEEARLYSLLDEQDLPQLAVAN